MDIQIETLTYEQAFSELERIIAELESGAHSLEESLNFYERGEILAKYCAKLLEQAELKIKSLHGREIIDLQRPE